MSYNKGAVRDLIVKAFSDEDLEMFCSDQYSEVYEGFAGQMSKTYKAFRLVDYCYRHGVLADLVGKLEAKFPVRYKELESRIVGDRATPSVVDELREEVSEYGAVFESPDEDRVERSPRPDRTEPGQTTTHPLDGSAEEIRRWFLDQLNPNQQVFVACAALFSGLEHQELMAIYRDVSTILIPAQKDQGEE